MISSDVIQLFDLIYPNDPILTRERLLESVQLWILSRKSGPSNPILGLPRREEGVVVVIRHLIPIVVGARMSAESG